MFATTLPIAPGALEQTCPLMPDASLQTIASRTPSIAYLAPDLTDPALGRRVTMLEAGGASVAVAGFRRGDQPLNVAAAEVLGRTVDADLGQRLKAVLGVLARPWRIAAFVRGQDLILARNLEMLVIAEVALALGNPRARLVYECLDIHRIMLGEGLKSNFLRWVERGLLRRVSLILVSSPGFTREYFSRRHPHAPPSLLVENRPLSLTAQPVVRPGPVERKAPWRIGWFGMIRCRRSFDILKSLARAMKGDVEVIIRGRPTPAVFPDFERDVAATPYFRFGGAYAAQDLPQLYEEVDFVWTMDFYEAGQNSSWLLPNRLYEGGAFDKPALAERQVEAGRWLMARGSGVVFGDPEPELLEFFRSLTPEAYCALVASARRVPRADLVCDRAACQALVHSLIA